MVFTCLFNLGTKDLLHNVNSFFKVQTLNIIMSNMFFCSQRRPLFYMCNLLFPCFLISSVAVLGFLLPPTSGEKVSLQITVLLSLSVFQLITLELIPPVGSLSFIGICNPTPFLLTHWYEQNFMLV